MHPHAHLFCPAPSSPRPIPAAPSSTPPPPRGSPVCVVPDPIRGGDNVLVMCDVLDAQGVPHESNTRAKVRAGGRPTWLPEQRGTTLQGLAWTRTRLPRHLHAAALCGSSQCGRMLARSDHAPAPSLSVTPSLPCPQLEAIINDTVKAEAPLFGFEQEYTMLSKGEGEPGGPTCQAACRSTPHRHAHCSIAAAVRRASSVLCAAVPVICPPHPTRATCPHLQAATSTAGPLAATPPPRAPSTAAWATSLCTAAPWLRPTWMPA